MASAASAGVWVERGLQEGRELIVGIEGKRVGCDCGGAKLNEAIVNDVVVCDVTLVSTRLR